MALRTAFLEMLNFLAMTLTASPRPGEADGSVSAGSKGSIIDVVEPQIRELLEQWPQMPATVIAERIGWGRGLTVLKERVRELRPARRSGVPDGLWTWRAGLVRSVLPARRDRQVALNSVVVARRRR